MWKQFFFFFLYAAVVSIHFLYPVQGRFSWKPCIVLIKNILNYCRSSLNLKSTYAYIQLILIVCNGVWLICKEKELIIYSKSYSMVTWVGMFGAPPGGGEGTNIFQLSSCKTLHINWLRRFLAFRLPPQHVYIKKWANALMFHEKND